MHKGFEVRFADGPGSCWEIVVVMTDCHISVERLLSRFSNMSIHQENVLMDPRIVRYREDAGRICG